MSTLRKFWPFLGRFPSARLKNRSRSHYTVSELIAREIGPRLETLNVESTTSPTSTWTSTRFRRGMCHCRTRRSRLFDHFREPYPKPFEVTRSRPRVFARTYQHNMKQGNRERRRRERKNFGIPSSISQNCRILSPSP